MRAVIVDGYVYNGVAGRGEAVSLQRLGIEEGPAGYERRIAELRHIHGREAFKRPVGIGCHLLFGMGQVGVIRAGDRTSRRRKQYNQIQQPTHRVTQIWLCAPAFLYFGRPGRYGAEAYTRHGNIGGMVAHVDFSDVTGGQAEVVYEEAHDVAARDFFLTPRVDVEGGG